jgi:hypothetical protein
MLLAAAVFTSAGGYIHLREWLDGYRGVPESVPGGWVVRTGFLVNAGASFLLAAALLLVAVKFQRLLIPALIASIGFQAGSLAVLIASRRGTVFGWSEPVWTLGANQTRAVEIGALLTLAIVGALATATRRPAPRLG